MKNISHLICAAGEGSRMREVSHHTPKPLLHLKGITLLEHSLASLPLIPNDEVLLLHRFDPKDFEVADEILQRFCQDTGTRPLSVRLDRLTAGQAETAAVAQNTISHSRIAIFNSDTYFQSLDLTRGLREGDFDGLASCARALGHQWSFFKTDTKGPFYRATAVKEKERISDWCSTGFYYFKDADKFFAHVAHLLKTQPSTQELYVAPIYNQWIAKGGDIRVVDCEKFQPMGTPEQVSTYWNVSLAEFKKDNA